MCRIALSDIGLSAKKQCKLIIVSIYTGIKFCKHLRRIAKARKPHFSSKLSVFVAKEMKVCILVHLESIVNSRFMSSEHSSRQYWIDVSRKVFKQLWTCPVVFKQQDNTFLGHQPSSFVLKGDWAWKQRTNTETNSAVCTPWLWFLLPYAGSQGHSCPRGSALFFSTRLFLFPQLSVGVRGAWGTHIEKETWRMTLHWACPAWYPNPGLDLLLRPLLLQPNNKIWDCRNCWAPHGEPHPQPGPPYLQRPSGCWAWKHTLYLYLQSNFSHQKNTSFLTDDIIVLGLKILPLST